MATRMFRGRVAAALTVAVIVGIGGVAQATTGGAEDAVVPPVTNPVEEPTSGGEVLSEDLLPAPEPDSSVPTEEEGEQSEASPALVAPFSAPGVGGPSPFAADDKTISNGELCSSSYLQDGVLTIDLFQDGLVSSDATLTIGDPDNDDAVSCINDITSIEIVNTGADGYKHLDIAQYTFSQNAFGMDNTLKTLTFPAGLETLTIGNSAFSQTAGGGASIALTSVDFPDSLETLTIGDSAFYQYATEGGSNALTSVDFPDNLETLTIGDSAFRQYADGGDNALESISFPDSLATLTIDDFAFSQSVGGGGGNALTSVVFPDGLETLTIKDYAFYQYSNGGDNALETVVFPDGPETLIIGEYAFSQDASGGGNNALASMNFPGSLKTLTIGVQAFSQDASGGGGNTLTSVDFPDNLETLNIGGSAFSQYASGGGGNALTSVDFPDNLDELTIEGYTFYQYANGGVDNALTSVDFPDNLVTLTIGFRAFYQYAHGGGSNALTSMDFPDNLETLTLGDSAFYQYADDGGSNALTSVDFPDSLETLTIGDLAFYQTAYGGDNALGSVLFPVGLGTLAIGDSAFSQDASEGGSNALTSVVLPVGLEKLDVDDGAFFLDQDPAGLVLFFPFTEDGVPVQVSLGKKVTNGSGSDGSKWVWLGPDGADTTDWRSDTNQYALRGTLSATFEPNGGTLSGADQLFIFPAVDGVPQVASLDQVADLDPAGFHSGNPSYLLEMPTVEPATSWGGTATFGSWCAGEWADGACEVSPSPLGVAVELEAGLSPYLFRATWQVMPPSPVLVPSAGCGLAPTVSIPDGVEGLFTYTSAEEGGRIVVSAEPGAPYVLLTDGVWSFDVSLPTYTVSFALDGGTGSFPNINVEGDGCMITLPTQIPTKDGHTFKGWLPTRSDQTTGLVLAPGAQFQVTQDVTMSAQWEAVVVPPKPVVPPINPGDPDDKTNPDKPTVESKTETKTVTKTLSNTGGSILPYVIAGLALLAIGGTTLSHRKRRNR